MIACRLRVERLEQLLIVPKLAQVEDAETLSPVMLQCAHDVVHLQHGQIGRPFELERLRCGQPPGISFSLLEDVGVDAAGIVSIDPGSA